MVLIGVDSSNLVFYGAPNKKGHQNGQLQIQVQSLESGVLNEVLGKLNVKNVSKFSFLRTFIKYSVLTICFLLV